MSMYHFGDRSKGGKKQQLAQKKRWLKATHQVSSDISSASADKDASPLSSPTLSTPATDNQREALAGTKNPVPSAMNNSSVSQGDSWQVASDWLSIPSIREQRRFLEAHPELLIPGGDTLLTAIGDDLKRRFADALHSGNPKMQQVMIALQHIAHSQRTLRIARALGGTRAAIETTYVELYGGLALNVPAWLAEVEQQLASLFSPQNAQETIPARMMLLSNAISRAQTDENVLPAVLAELYVLSYKTMSELSGPQAVVLQEEKIACLEAAALIYRLDRYPARYAQTQTDLGITYCQEVRTEKRVEHQQKGIACFKRTLQVFTPQSFPKEHASILNNLGKMYALLEEGERRANIEESIRYYSRALRIFTFQAFPNEYAQVQTSLGRLYQQRIDGERRANQEEAINCFTRSLQVYTHDAFPQSFAANQNSLGLVYTMRVAGEFRINIEKAISSFQRALFGYTPEAFADDYARVQANLGTAFIWRIEGDERENLNEAIACFQRALQIHTLDAFPERYALEQMSLGNVYKRRDGREGADLEDAIACYRRALLVYTRDAFPIDYAKLQYSLGFIYLDRVREGPRAINREEAIAYVERAAQFFTREVDPLEYAKVQLGLGLAYQDRIAGEQGANQEQAMTHYLRALQVYTLAAFPQQYRSAHRNIARLEAGRGRWEAAHNAYSSASAAEEMLLATGTGLAGLDAVFQYEKSSTTYDGFALARLARFAEAAAVIEQGRARGLAEAMALNQADPGQISDPALRTRYITAQERLITTQMLLNGSQMSSAGLAAPGTDPAMRDQEQRPAIVEFAHAYQQAREEFQAVVAEVRAAHPAFLNEAVEPDIILQAAEKCGPGHALVYLAATPWGGFALAAFATDPASRSKAHFAAFDLPALTDDFVQDLIIRPFDKVTTTRFLGGFGLAQLGGDNNSLLLQGWDGQTLRARAEALHAACQAAHKESSLNDAFQETIANAFSTSPLDKPVDEVEQEELSVFLSLLRDAFLQHELKRCLDRLATAAFIPLIPWLRQEGAKSVTFIPCGELALFPLIAAEVAQGQTVGDVLKAASVAPSARSLLDTGQSDTQRAGVYALGDPRPTPSELEWGEAEAHTLAKLARDMQLPAEITVHEQATRQWLIDALQKGKIVEVSCHGSFNFSKPLQSALALAQNQKLTLGEMLNYQADLRGLRLLILSACQTEIIARQGSPEEVRSLTAGMLQAGARAVLGSLWSVNDKASYLLMVRFAQEWLPHMEQEPPAAALVRAQRWLRTVTQRELQNWHNSDVPLPTVQEKQLAGSLAPEHDPWEAEAKRLLDLQALVSSTQRGDRYTDLVAEQNIRRVAQRMPNPDARPFADPVYWAGFRVTGW